MENEPIVGDRLFSGVKTAGMLPRLIPAGMRAMSVPVDEVSDISGFVLPGAHVDILVAISDSSTGGQPFSVVGQFVTHYPTPHVTSQNGAGRDHARRA